LGLSSLEHHLAVSFRVQRLSENLIVVTVLLAKESEHIWGILSHFNVLIDDQLVVDNIFSLSQKCLLTSSHAFLGRSRALHDAFLVFITLNGTDVPLLPVFNLNRVQNKGVLVRMIVVLVDLVVLEALWSANCVLRHRCKDDVDELDIE